MKYDTIIFDFDFTLVDASGAIINCMNYALGMVGEKEKTSDAIRKTIGMTLKRAFFMLTGCGEDENGNVSRLADDFLVHFKEQADKIMAKNTALMPDTLDVLRKLRADNLSTAIVTNKFAYRIREVLDIYKITDLIGYIVGYEDVADPKPLPEGVNKAIAYFNADISRALYIGDSLVDAETAANAGIDFAAVTTGETSADDFKKYPNVMVSATLTELFSGISLF